MPHSVSSPSGRRIGSGLFVSLGWCWRVDSNHRPTDYESVALPAELRQPASRVRRVSAHYISGKTAGFSTRFRDRLPEKVGRGAIRAAPRQAFLIPLLVLLAIPVGPISRRLDGDVGLLASDGRLAIGAAATLARSADDERDRE